MKRWSVWALFLALFVVLSAGCMSRVGDFTALSTHNIPIRTDEGEMVTESDCKELLLFGLITVGRRNLKEAVDGALEQNSGHLLMDVALYDLSYPVIPLLWHRDCIRLKGRSVKITP